MTSRDETYWQIGHRIVEFEQRGTQRAEYGAELLAELSADLTRRFGRGFSSDNLELMRRFYRAFSHAKISETVSRILPGGAAVDAFPLPWSHYVLLVRKSRSPEALAFYHTEALRGGWSVRQLDRQIASQFYERTALSRDKAAISPRANKPNPVTLSPPRRRSAIH